MPSFDAAVNREMRSVMCGLVHQRQRQLQQLLLLTNVLNQLWTSRASSCGLRRAARHGGRARGHRPGAAVQHVLRNGAGKLTSRTGRSRQRAEHDGQRVFTEMFGSTCSRQPRTGSPSDTVTTRRTGAGAQVAEAGTTLLKNAGGRCAGFVERGTIARDRAVRVGLADLRRRGQRVRDPVRHGQPVAGIQAAADPHERRLSAGLTAEPRAAIRRPTSRRYARLRSRQLHGHAHAPQTGTYVRPSPPVGCYTPTYLT